MEKNKERYRSDSEKNFTEILKEIRISLKDINISFREFDNGEYQLKSAPISEVIDKLEHYKATENYVLGFELGFKTVAQLLSIILSLDSKLDNVTFLLDIILEQYYWRIKEIEKHGSDRKNEKGKISKRDDLVE